MNAAASANEKISVGLSFAMRTPRYSDVTMYKPNDFTNTTISLHIEFTASHQINHVEDGIETQVNLADESNSDHELCTSTSPLQRFVGVFD